MSLSKEQVESHQSAKENELLSLTTSEYEQLASLSKQGDTEAQLKIEKYIQALKISADNGKKSHQYKLGTLYLEGKGCIRDFVSAAGYFEKAAEQGYRYAQFSIATCYLYGQGVKKDPNKAIEYYKKAAVQGVVQALDCLGDCYRDGKGVRQDIHQAIYYYSLAQKQKHAKSNEKLNSIRFTHPTHFNGEQQSINNTNSTPNNGININRARSVSTPIPIVNYSHGQHTQNNNKQKHSENSPLLIQRNLKNKNCTNLIDNDSTLSNPQATESTLCLCVIL